MLNLAMAIAKECFYCSFIDVTDLG